MIYIQWTLLGSIALSKIALRTFERSRPVLLDPQQLGLASRHRRNKPLYLPQITTRLLDTVLPIITFIFDVRLQHFVYSVQESVSDSFIGTKDVISFPS